MEATTSKYDLARALSLLPPIFVHCIDGEGGFRWSLDRPHETGGFVYASNGSLAIRVPTPEGFDVPNGEGRYPDMREIFGGEFRPEPAALPAIEARPCEACDGTLVRPAGECPECEGEGETDHDCDCEHCTEDYDECEECDGTGKVGPRPCDACERTGLHGEGASVDVGGWCLRDHYVAMLAKFGASVHLPTQPDSPGNVHAIRFVVGDVEGRVMPITRHR